MKEVRWGIIGCGAVTEVKSGPALQQTEHSRVVAVMRRNGVLAEDYAKRHGVARWYEQADQLIQDPEVNAIYVATPPAFHMEYTLAAAKAGKAVYVEKPMALNEEQCRKMIAACETADVPLYVAYYRRALPRFLKIKQLLEEGRIGNVNFVSSVQYQPLREEDQQSDQLPWRVQPALAGGGYFFDLASHTLDMLDYLLGPIEQAKGFASNQAGRYPAEDIVTGSYQFIAGAHGTGTWCFSAYERKDQNEIVGTHGRLCFSTFGQEPIELHTAEGVERWEISNPLHVQHPLIQTMVDDLRGEGKCPSTGKSAIRTNWVMDQLAGGYYSR